MLDQGIHVVFHLFGCYRFERRSRERADRISVLAMRSVLHGAKLGGTASMVLWGVTLWGVYLRGKLLPLVPASVTVEQIG